MNNFNIATFKSNDKTTATFLNEPKHDELEVGETYDQTEGNVHARPEFEGGKSIIS